MAPSEEKIAAMMRDVNQPRIQSLADELAGDIKDRLTEGVPMLTGEKDYNAWWQALRRQLQVEPNAHWEAFYLAINDATNLMADDELDQLSEEDYNQHVIMRALYLLQLNRAVAAMRATMSPALNGASRAAGNHPFILLWWIQSRFDECRPDDMAFMPELLRDLKVQRGPQQRVLDIRGTQRDWDDWNAFDMEQIGLVTYIQLIGNEKAPSTPSTA